MTKQEVLERFGEEIRDVIAEWKDEPPRDWFPLLSATEPELNLPLSSPESPFSLWGIVVASNGREVYMYPLVQEKATGEISSPDAMVDTFWCPIIGIGEGNWSVEISLEEIEGVRE
jgi:hypothetical protein